MTKVQIFEIYNSNHFESIAHFQVDVSAIIKD